MKAPTGRYETIRTGEEEYRAFVPDPLPPPAALITSTELTAATERAALALGRLDGAAHVLPNTDLFLYSCVRKEAVLSSQIEGTQSTLSDLLGHELGATPDVPLDDIAETSKYVVAVNMAFEQMGQSYGLAAVQPSAARRPCHRAAEWTRCREAARRVSYIAELDRRLTSGHRAVRATAAAPSRRIDVTP